MAVRMLSTAADFFSSRRSVRNRNKFLCCLPVAFWYWNPNTRSSYCMLVTATFNTKCTALYKYYERMWQTDRTAIHNSMPSYDFHRSTEICKNVVLKWHAYTYYTLSFLDAVAKTWGKKATTYVMSVRPSARNNSAPAVRIFMKFDILLLF
jgi:hypothetical protein